MQLTSIRQFPRTERGALACATAPGLAVVAAVVAGAGMAATSSNNFPVGFAGLILDVLFVMPIALLGLYLPSAIVIFRKLAPGPRPATERLLRVLGASGVFGFLLGASCGWVSLAGYGLLGVDWAGNWTVRILLVVLVWAAVATVGAVKIAQAGLKATKPKRQRKPATTKTVAAAAKKSAKTAPRKRAAGHSRTAVNADSLETTPDAAGA